MSWVLFEEAAVYTDTQATYQPGSAAFLPCILGLNISFPLFSFLFPQPYHHQSTTPPTTGIYWYKQPSLSWLIKTTWTSTVRVNARTDGESEQPAYLPGHRALSLTEQCRIKSILAFDDLHMNTSGTQYYYFFFGVTVESRSCKIRWR